jgi:hypothetical protein
MIAGSSPALGDKSEQTEQGTEATRYPRASVPPLAAPAPSFPPHLAEAAFAKYPCGTSRLQPYRAHERPIPPLDPILNRHPDILGILQLHRTPPTRHHMIHILPDYPFHRQCQQADPALEDSRHPHKRRIESLDREIDQRVYALYGLTEAEIKIIEGG